MVKFSLMKGIIFAPIYLLCLNVYSQTLSGQQMQIEEDIIEVDFDPFEWADTQLAKVNFLDNPKNDRAFMLNQPKGWVSVKDISNLFQADYLKKLSKQKQLSELQSAYRYIIIAKSLDALFWKNDPYYFYPPVHDLQQYTKDFLLEIISQRYNFERSQTSEEQMYKVLVKEIVETNQEFALNIQWPFCDLLSMKKSCAALKLRKIPFELTEMSLVFTELPQTLNEFLNQAIPQLKQWYASSRRLSTIDSILKIQATNSNNVKSPSRVNLSKKFYDYLWNNIYVFTYADYCVYPTVICNKFDAQKFQIEITNQNIEILRAIKLVDEE